MLAPNEYLTMSLKKDTPLALDLTTRSLLSLWKSHLGS